MFEIMVWVSLGLLFFWLPRWFPDRPLHHEPEWRWDLIGLVAILVFGLLYDHGFEGPLFSLVASWPAFDHWQTVFFDAWHPLAVLALFFVLADFGLYWTHRALHHPRLWKQHRFHHSIRHVNVVSGLRGSFIHVLVSIAPYSIAMALVPVMAYDGLLTFIVVFTILNQHYLHSNVRVPGARWLEWVFMTPRSHVAHHVAREAVANANYGTIFSIWDRLFGTWVSPDTISHDERHGLEGTETHWRMIFGLSIPEDAIRQAPAENHSR